MIRNILFFTLIFTHHLLISQNAPFEVHSNETYFLDHNGGVHKGVGHKYAYIRICDFDGENYVCEKEAWLNTAFSLFMDYFFTGNGEKYFYEHNGKLSDEEKMVFDLREGGKLILYANRELWLFSDFNSEINNYMTLTVYTKVRKSRWFDD